jgi:hypothetical protein
VQQVRLIQKGKIGEEVPRYGDKGLSWPRLEPVQRATGSQAGKFERPLTEFLSHLTTKAKFVNDISHK